MNAINFIKQHGIDKAREVVEGAPEKATVVSAETFGYFYKYQDSPVWCRVYRRKPSATPFAAIFSPIINPIELSDLKRLVESVELVQSYGGVGLLEYKVRCLGQELSDSLRQAIADYESIYSGEEH